VHPHYLCVKKIHRKYTSICCHILILIINTAEHDEQNHHSQQQSQCEDYEGSLHVLLGETSALAPKPSSPVG
jgi:hypothetical protein